MPIYSCFIACMSVIWVNIFGGELPAQNEIPLLPLVNKTLYFLLIKIYENTTGEDYQSAGKQEMMLVESVLWAMTEESFLFMFRPFPWP